MRHFALASILYGLAVHAAPAPQDATNPAGTLLGPEGLCSSTGDYWNGFQYVPCAEGVTCRDGHLAAVSDVVPAGVSAPAEAPASSQVTEVQAGASEGAATLATTEAGATDGTGSGGTSVTADATASSQATGVVGGASDETMSITLAGKGVAESTGGADTSETGSVTEVQAGATSASATAATATGAVQSGSGTTTGGTTLDSITDLICVDDRPNKHVNITKSPTDKWEMTGPECEARSSTDTKPRFVAYWSQWSTPGAVPSKDQLEGVTHLVLSFAASDGTMWAWDDMAETKPNPFSKATVSGLKQQYPELKVLAAFGGWNLDFGFADNAASGTMLPLAERIVKFRADNGLDGIDLDWEFPVGNGAFYKSCHYQTDDYKLPERPYEADAYVDLMRHIRHLDPDTILSVAVPARKEDRELAFTKDTVSKMDPCLDEWNLMTYDAMNRRDNKAFHHAGSNVIKDVIEYYQFDDVVDKKKMNIGFPNYAKYFTLDNSTSAVECTAKGGIGCPIYPAEGPAGQDIGVSGAWQFNQAQWEFYNDGNDRAKLSWPLAAAAEGTRDTDAGASSWVDTKNRLFWTWTSPEDIEQSCTDHLADVGGVMAWSLNQDTNGAAGGPHFAAMAKCVGAQGGGSAGTGGDAGAISASASASTSASASDSASDSALTSASDATSATEATTSATEAATSATEAATSATEATTSAA